MRIAAQNVYDVNMSFTSTKAASATAEPEPERSYHHGNLKSSLIEAGIQALQTVRPDELSLRQLAKDVGVSANAAYRHFADKEALLCALATEGFTRFAQAQAQAVAGVADAQERLKASGLAYVDFAMQHPSLYQLMFSRIDRAPQEPELALAASSGMSVLLEAASSLLQAPAHDERVRVAAAGCWSLVHGLSALAQGGQLAVFGLPMPELIARVMALPSLVGPAVAPPSH